MIEQKIFLSIPQTTSSFKFCLPPKCLPDWPSTGVSLWQQRNGSPAAHNYDWEEAPPPLTWLASPIRVCSMWLSWSSPRPRSAILSVFTSESGDMEIGGKIRVDDVIILKSSFLEILISESLHRFHNQDSHTFAIQAFLRQFILWDIFQPLYPTIDLISRMSNTDL